MKHIKAFKRRAFLRVKLKIEKEEDFSLPKPGDSRRRNVKLHPLSSFKNKFLKIMKTK